MSGARRPPRAMVIAGLTGSIAMGKSMAAMLLRHLGVPVHDADEVVHRLLGPGGAAAVSVVAAFPDAVRGGAVDRRALGDLVFADSGRLARLEGILHPLVRADELTFLHRQCRLGARLVVLDIPLLFETGAQARLDAIITVTAPPRVQRWRALTRPGMSEARLRAIGARQVPDRVKRRRADYVVVAGPARSYTLRVLGEIVRSLHKQKSRHWPPTGRAWRGARRSE